MELIDQLRAIAERLQEQREFIKTEEATKMASVMPVIQTLGYNVFDPREVVPEFTADVGTKKGEKVDYAIMKDGKPVMLIECKTLGSKLTVENASQLFRYFSVVPTARLAILTDGQRYQFYSDIDAPNIMDHRPFMEMDLLALDEHVVLELVKRLTRKDFDIEGVIDAASNLRYTREIKAVFAKQLTEPEDDFIKFFVSHIYSGSVTQKVRERFAPVVTAALNQYIRERISNRLNAALAQEDESQNAAPTPAVEDAPDAEDNGIITTEEELEAFRIIKAIVRPDVSLERLELRDAKSYCNVLLDQNNRKPLVRLYFNTANKSMGIFSKEGEERVENKVGIEGLDDIYTHADAIRAGLKSYLGSDANKGEDEPAPSPE